jgi:NADH-quinone oxidoreductase subunit G
MACDGGCVGGGGQPIHPENNNIKARAKSIYELDEKESNRFAHQNASLQSVYDSFLKNPGSEASLAHLYTTYEEREVMR